MRKVTTTVTFLDMRAKSAPHVPQPNHAGRLMLLHAPKPPVMFYRYLYEAVGRPWIWVNRRRLDDERLAALVQDERVEIYVLYADGAPAGYAEIDRRKTGHAELAYFGLTPDFIGRGLGAWFLKQAVDLAWAKAPGFLTVQTCTLDHPRALANYQRAGFRPVAQEVAEVLPIGDEPHPLVAAMRV
jgi:GNAT superfamily N-acetyltransferase